MSSLLRATPVVTALSALYLLVLGILSVYGGHRSYLVWKRWRVRRRLDPAPPPPASDGPPPLPLVTVQLPLFNEAAVAERLIAAVVALDYPRDRLDIQVLDDSTDETRAVVAAAVARLAAGGVPIRHLHRKDRRGYKAGALADGLRAARGELVAVFDADFLPSPDFLRRLVPHFQDEKVAMVQARWGHLNREHSMLTQVAALMLDGHHVVENRIRDAAGWFFNFAGTGGMWRISAIADSGGWQHDTLTEDLDLSYRAQLRGWKFVYRSDVVVPGELPESMTAFRVQQYRWARGTVQTRRKLLARLMRAPVPWGARVEAFFHLTPHIAYPLTLLLGLLLLPVVVALRDVGMWSSLLWDLPLFLATTGSLAAFYALSQADQGRRPWDGLRWVPGLLIIGVGLTPLVTRAFFDGQRRMSGEFVRTPKRGAGPTRYRTQSTPLPWLSFALFLYSSAAVVATIICGHIFAAPFALMFAAGYGHVTWSLSREALTRLSTTTPTFTQVFAPSELPEN